MIIFRCEDWTAVIASLPFLALFCVMMWQTVKDVRNGRLWFLATKKYHWQQKLEQVHHKRHPKMFWVLTVGQFALISGCMVALMWNISSQCSL
jgi:hypothetical protein